MLGCQHIDNVCRFHIRSGVLVKSTVADDDSARAIVHVVVGSSSRSYPARQSRTNTETSDVNSPELANLPNREVLSPRTPRIRGTPSIPCSCAREMWGEIPTDSVIPNVRHSRCCSYIGEHDDVTSKISSRVPQCIAARHRRIIVQQRRRLDTCLRQRFETVQGA